MKILLSSLVLLAGAAAFAEGEPVPVRNPFWPIGYEGERAIITAEPRVKVKPPTVTETKDETQTAAQVAAVAAAAAAASSPKSESMSQYWIEARGALSVDSPLIVTRDGVPRRSSVMINGKVYADGDFVSITHAGRRFTWKVMGLNDSDVLKLVRVRVRKVDEPAKESEKGKTK